MTQAHTTASAQLSLDALYQRPTLGIPTWQLFIMEHAHIERLAGRPPDSYRDDPISTYGYEAYFSAYALYPDLIERHFALQADLALLNNRAAARAYREGHLPPLHRLDHDMADGRGLLVRPATLDRLWFPHFSRCLAPVLDAGIRLIWHCDGNLMAMVPRLLDVGLHGFQGFQVEHGMDYERICRMRTRDGDPLIIFAGVSVTRTLPYGTPADVRSELRWLVENGPPTGLFLGASNSITPGVPWANLHALIEGLAHYRTLT